MKTLIIGLFSLALLASGAAWGQSRSPAFPQGNLPNLGSQNACQGNGIMVIVVDNNGNVKAYKCAQARGRTIRREPQLDPKKTWTLTVYGSLGTISKYQATGETDPCEWWVIGGTSYYFCW